MIGDGSGVSDQHYTGVALFDLDQTLIPWDTQLLFVNWVIQHEPMRRLYLPVFALFTPFAKVIGTEGMKRIFLTYLFGMRKERVTELVDSFVKEIVPKHCYPAMLEELEKQKSMGRQTVLMTASPAFYGEKIGAALGFDLAIGTDVDLGERVGLFPDILDGNNKGENKLVRLKKRAPEVLQGNYPLSNSSGFSDSHADLPMLRVCEEAMMVNPTSGLEAQAESHWVKVTPVRPTKGKLGFGVACLLQIVGLWKF